MNLIQINIQNKNWEFFFKLSFEYLNELWPKDFNNYEIFKKDYSQELIDKIKQGNRGLFLVYDNKRLIGLINIYLTNETIIDGFSKLISSNNDKNLIITASTSLEEKNNLNTLNIAEFYIKPEFRFRGYGTKLLDLIIKWGKARFAKYLKMEVDKTQETSNKFWSSFNFKLDNTQKRNIYFKKI